MIQFIKNLFNQSKHTQKMKTGILHSILQKSKDNKEIISIWQYNNDKGSIVGYITEINDEYIWLQKSRLSLLDYGRSVHMFHRDLVKKSLRGSMGQIVVGDLTYY